MTRFDWFRPASALMPLLVLTVILGIEAGPVCAQKNKDEAGAQKAELQRKAHATFVDAKQTKSARLNAIRQIRVAADEHLPGLLKVLKNDNDHDEVRLAAAHLHEFNDAWIESASKILLDAKDGGEQLDAGLAAAMRQRSVNLDVAQQQKIHPVFRKLLDDERKSVRTEAYRALAGSGDELAIKKLTDGLSRGNAPIDLHEAVELLHSVGSSDHFNVLRRYLDSDDPKVQHEIVQALANDPRSRPAIIKLLGNNRIAESVRIEAVRSLGRHDPGFAEYAFEIVTDEGAPPALRYAAVKSFVGRMNYEDVDANQQVEFAKRVEAFASDIPEDLSAKSQRSLKQLLPYLRENFEAIKKHYDR